MIYLFTDFGWQGPYVGQMKSILLHKSPATPIIDLMHDAPCFDPKASAYLLSALIEHIPSKSIVLGVVDPGVGDQQRRPIIIKADDRWYLGPDNGLFNAVAMKANSLSCWEIVWRPEVLSNSFHGRDLFAPVAADLATDTMPQCREISNEDVLRRGWPENYDAVIYIDHFGNCMTGRRADTIDKSKTITIAGWTIPYAGTFSEVKSGEAFWYENSSGLLEIAVNSGRADQVLGLSLGVAVEW